MTVRYHRRGDAVVPDYLCQLAGMAHGEPICQGIPGASVDEAIANLLVEAMTPLALTFYAGICGWTLARAHARSGDPIAIAGYLGGGEEFDQSITGFCERYADQNEQDYQEFTKAVRSGRLEAAEGV